MRQKKCKMIGEMGCYFLCIVKLVEIERGVNFDIFDVYDKAVEIGAIDRDCYINNPYLLANTVLGLECKFDGKRDKFYKCKSDEIEILVFKNGCFTHFVLGDGNGSVLYDPLGDSNTVKFGCVKSKRIFRRV